MSMVFHHIYGRDIDFFSLGGMLFGLDAEGRTDGMKRGVCVGVFFCADWREMMYTVWVRRLKIAQWYMYM